MVDKSATTALELKVAEIFVEDVGKGLVRIDPDDAKILGATLGDVVEIKEKKGPLPEFQGSFLNTLVKK